ncbi:hypothetical protein [Vannielia litorea]|uniref:hypothetical protein n=1 Tax=Vannielia litorea TaxID=1217970 RepID=UPI001BCE54B3|nr:hypothetical protein [Vannielia litorea]MBS8226550.1 hypothetical protein [Vannielia litorea]
MKGMPEEGAFTEGRVDPVSGQQWVHVTRAMALNHPQGRLNLALYATVVFFVAMAGWRLVLWANVLGGAWPVIEVVIFALAALALFLRAAPGAWLGVTGCGCVVIDFATGLKTGWSLQMFALAEVIMAVVVGFYLLTGARPNLIYRHRFLRERGEG